MKMNVADFLVFFLKKNNIDCVFGYPGGAALPLYDALSKVDGIKHYITCHEQAAIHAAEGYARSTGKIAVVFTTSGPGATNIVTGIANAWKDSTGIVAITSQVNGDLISKNSFQEVDICDMVKKITKKTYFIDKANSFDSLLKEGFELAISGRKGPVLIDITKDTYGQEIEFNEEDILIKKQKVKSDLSKIGEIVNLLKDAKRPVFYCGGGFSFLSNNILEQFRNFIKSKKMPITQTLMGLGVYASDEFENLQMLGMHGSYEANMAMYNSDLVIVLGARFDDRVTGIVEQFCPNASFIHVDIDISEFGKIKKADISIQADLEEFIPEFCKQAGKVQFCDISDWWKQIEEWRKVGSFNYKQRDNEVLLPQFVIDEICKYTEKKNPIITTDVGQHQMWTAQYIKLKDTKKLITSGGLGTMGFGIPAAIGAQIGNRNDLVICITSDGSFTMNSNELLTIANNKLPVKIVIVNNGNLGMVAQWQRMFYDNRSYETNLRYMSVNVVQYVNSFGIKADTVHNYLDFKEKLKNLYSNEPYLMNVIVKDDENVCPMIVPGKAHHEMVLSRFSNKEFI